jgi:hypothetical protein
MKIIPLVEIHEKLYAEASRILEDTNPCQWKDGNCFAGTHGCCQGCKHLGPTGCTVKSLSCRVWLCAQLKNTKKGQAVAQHLGLIRNIGQACGIRFLVRSVQAEECSFTSLSL